MMLTRFISQDIKVEYLSLDLVLPYLNNARTHPKQQISQLKAAILEFGFTNPILVDTSRNVIAGHGRLIAARELGLVHIPVITLNGLSAAQIKALRLADNKLALNSGWDTDLLRVELTELMNLDVTIDLSLTAFSGGEIDVILSSGEDAEEPTIPAVPVKPKTNIGDIWELGDHRVGCGDGRDREFLHAIVGSKQVDCAFLDPPYNVRIGGHANVKKRHREFAMASGEMNGAEFRCFLEETLGSCVSLSRDGAVHFVCMDWRHHDDLSAVGHDLYGDQLNLCIWNKSNAGMGSLYRSKHELVFVYRVGSVAHYNAVQLGKHGRNRTNVWNYSSVNSFGGHRRSDLALHPTVKPIALVADSLKDVTRLGDTVLDIFLGAGTTLLAAERTGRIFRGLDLDPGYVDVAIDRWVAMTGKAPQLMERAG